MSESNYVLANLDFIYLFTMPAYDLKQWPMREEDDKSFMWRRINMIDSLENARVSRLMSYYYQPVTLRLNNTVDRCTHVKSSIIIDG